MNLSYWRHGTNYPPQQFPMSEAPAAQSFDGGLRWPPMPHLTCQVGPLNQILPTHSLIHHAPRMIGFVPPFPSCPLHLPVAPFLQRFVGPSFPTVQHSYISAPSLPIPRKRSVGTSPDRLFFEFSAVEDSQIEGQSRVKTSSHPNAGVQTEASDLEKLIDPCLSAKAAPKLGVPFTRIVSSLSTPAHQITKSEPAFLPSENFDPAPQPSLPFASRDGRSQKELGADCFSGKGSDDGSVDDNHLLDFDAKTDEIQLTHFQNLNKILILIFSGREITEADWCLTHLESKILNSILQRKFASKIRAEGLRMDDPDRCAFINRLAKVNTLKRPKDAYKMLLGRLFRILKRNFFEKHATSNQNMYLFYCYYFGETARTERLPIQAYFYPFERNNKFTSLFPKISHHLNFRYYERIFKSERFARDIRLVLTKVYADHFAELRFKFKTLLRKWQRLFFSFDGDQEIVEKSILKYLQHNNRCKIPFTAIEIRNSILLFENMISKFGRHEAPEKLDERFK